MKTWTEYFVCNLVLLLAFTFCIVLIFSTNASAHTWQIEKVDNAERYTETAIAISQAGFPHIVYSDIRYAYHDSGRWNLDPSFESYPSNSGYSLAIDANGLPHLCYYNLSRELVYKHYNGKKWQSYYWDLQLFSTRPVHPSLQLDNYGRPHIVHPDDGVLCYRYFDGTTWQKKTFDTSVNSPNGELKLDSNGLPHIAYEIWSAVTDYSKLIYLRYDGESWHQELLFSGKNLRGWEFDLDSNDAPHFVILNIDLKHLYTTEIGWQTDVLETANTNYYYLNFKIDSQDNMHLAYYDHENKDLIYAFYDGTLRKETVDQQGDVGRYVSLAVDNNNLVHLAYIDDSLGHMKYARMISDYYPYAQFNMFGDDGEVPFEINFSDHSTGEITSWFWDFGDGATSTERNPVHIYQKPGHYDTSLIVSGPGGSSTKKLVNSVWAFQLPQGEKYIAYVGEKASFSFPNNVLTMIDCETNIVADQVNIPDTPHGLSTSKDGRNLLISLYTSGYAAKISTIDPEKATFFNVPGASGSVISPDDSQFYVCSDTAPHSRVTKINVHDDNYRFIDLEDFVGASTPIITPDSTSLFVADTAYKTDGGVLAHIKNPFSEDPIVEPVFIVGCSENALAISPNGRHIYASSRYDIIKIPIHNMHLPELQVKLRVPMAEAEFPWAMAISPDNRWLYMTTTINNVHIVDLNTFELVNTIVVGGNPRGVAITPDGKYAYVCRWFKICVIDVAQQTIIDEIPIDRWGFSITIAREPRSWCDILISPSSFQTCDVSGPYNSPGPKPSGLAFDGTYLWNADYTDDKIYKLDTSGYIIDSFDSPGPYPSGLAFDGTYLWNADYLDDKIYKLDTSGNIIDSFDSPGIAPMGLTFDGIYLWNADLGDDKIYKLDTSGNIIDSFDSPLSDPRGLAFDGTYLWHADNGVDIISKFCNVPGPAKVGSSKTRTFTITNAGKSDLEIDTLCITGADASEFIIENNSCSGQTVGVLGKCTVDVVFSPISTGKKTANLEIPSNDPDTPILIVTLDSTPLDTFNSDFNGDGDVDGSDLAEFAANFDAGLMVVFAAEFGR